jgi:uncharacterized protein YjbI with pentapeptide repeats
MADGGSNGKQCTIPFPAPDSVDLRGCDFSNSKYLDCGGPLIFDGPECMTTNVSLLDAQLQGANFTNAHWQELNLTGANMTGAVLEGAHFAELLACPAQLPPAWQCVKTGIYYALVGPKANLNEDDFDSVDLTGTDLSQATLVGAMISSLLGCPAMLPDPSWQCLPQAGGLFALVESSP